MAFKDNLWAAMQAKDIDREALARLVGVTRTAVSFWVSGKTVPRGQKLAKIAYHLGIPVTALFEGDPDGMPVLFQEHLLQESPPGVESGIAVGKSAPSSDDSADERDKAALLKIWDGLTITRRAQLFADLGLELPSLIRKRG